MLSQRLSYVSLKAFDELLGFLNCHFFDLGRNCSKVRLNLFYQLIDHRILRLKSLQPLANHVLRQRLSLFHLDNGGVLALGNHLKEGFVSETSQTVTLFSREVGEWGIVRLYEQLEVSLKEELLCDSLYVLEVVILLAELHELSIQGK